MSTERPHTAKEIHATRRVTRPTTLPTSPAHKEVRDPSGGPSGGGGWLYSRLFRQVDAASLAFFRIAFGVVMAVEVWHYFTRGWIGEYFVEPSFHFTYYGFGWVKPWPETWMYVHFAVLGVLAVFIAFGFLYRLSAALFFLGFTYVFLLDQTYYLNHFYLICLLSLLMILILAHRAFSVDAVLRPNLATGTAPAWSLGVLRFQVGVAYFFGGIAKLNGDWLRGEPMRMWLADSTDFPLVGRFFTEWWAAYFFSYGGLLLDLFAVPLLLWRRTRLFAFAAVVLFHVTNSQLFTIGMFPWLMIAATLIFFSPSWPRFLGGVRVAEILSPGASPASWSSLIRRPLAVEERVEKSIRSRLGGRRLSSRTRGLLMYAGVAVLALYVAVQVLVPLRHYLYPGDVSWTEEGHRFSWHMMLRDKDVAATFVSTDTATESTTLLYPRNYLTERQESEMLLRPDMMLQFAHHAADQLQAPGRGEVKVQGTVLASLNGRPYQPLVDPDTDLAHQPRNLAPAGWILPLSEPLPPPDNR